MSGMGGHQWWLQRQQDKNVDLPKGLVWRVVRFARPYRVKLAFMMITILVVSVLGVVPSFLYGEVIGNAIPNRKVALLGLLALAVPLVTLLTSLIGMLQRWLNARVGEGIIFDLRVNLFDHVQRMPIAFFTRTQTGALISRLNGDVVGAQRAVTETTAGALSVVADIVVVLGSMFKLNWKLSLWTLAIAPLFFLPIRKMGKVLQKIVRTQMDNSASMSTQMNERFQIGGSMLVKLFGDYDVENSNFSEKAANVRDLGIKSALVGRMFFMIFGLIGAVGMGLAYWIGGRMVIFGDMGMPAFVTFNLLIMRSYNSIAGLSSLPVDLKTALVSFDRVFEVLDFRSSITVSPSAIHLEKATGQVDFDHVWFRYPAGADVSLASLEDGRSEVSFDPEAWVLQDVSFSLKPGQMFALVGPSGAGKTTISMLLPRLYDANRGSVRIDGIDVKDLTVESIGASVGVVTQDPHMFHDTIRSNLLYAKPGATEQELIDAARAAQIYELVETLPDGFDTMVGERGYRLSGGEKQRLAIARLLLKNPAIMILDEATAHLDSESEVLIQRALSEALTGRSSLVIAHRLSTIISADQILVIDGGRVVEQGTHNELLGGSGLYEDLYRTQFAGAARNGVLEAEGRA